ncbi:MAG: hypothetical protein N3D12_06455 [Candidatus Methanomethyliaceae archaeon]|nr:hypothetical protein [Candidatus Methanomethyliaceae archaeon]
MPPYSRYSRGSLRESFSRKDLSQGQKSTFIDKVLRRKPEDVKTSVRNVYCYGTPARVRKTKSPEVAAPSQAVAKAIYEKWFDYTFVDLKTNLEQCRIDRKNLIKLGTGRARHEDEDRSSVNRVETSC